jgi:hypothetical protein
VRSIIALIRVVLPAPIGAKKATTLRPLSEPKTASATLSRSERESIIISISEHYTCLMPLLAKVINIPLNTKMHLLKLKFNLEI